jgi:plasmid stabilization system protein ParE
MRAFTVMWDARASHELSMARAFLGPSQEAALDRDLEHARGRLSAFPWIGPPALLGGKYSKRIRRYSLLRQPFYLYYQVDQDRELIVIRSMRHHRQRSPRL